MINNHGSWLLIWLALLILVATVAFYLLFVKESADYSVASLRLERAALVKQDIQFLSRGGKYAHYEVKAVSDKGDTVTAQYRLPAAESKTKALLWVYDEPRDLNMSEALDHVPQAQFAAVLALNIHDLFERDAQGHVDESRGNAWRGMAASKRSIDVLLQFLRKHHVNDTTQIYLGGADFAAPAALAAAAGLPHRLGGIGMVNLAGAEGMAPGWQEVDFVKPQTWSGEIHSKRIAQIESSDSAFAKSVVPGFTQTIEQIHFENTFGPNSELGSVVHWIVGADTASPKRFQPDTSLVRTTTVTLR